MSKYTYQQTYTLTAEIGVQVILSKQNDTQFEFVVDGNVMTSVTVGIVGSTASSSIEVKVRSNDSAYANSIITCNYPKVKNDKTSQCDLCFNLTNPGGDSYWSITGGVSQGDNPTIYKNSTPGGTATVEVQIPTKANSNVKPSPQPVLDPEMVFLLDKTDDALFFRGNAPLGAKTKDNPNQNIDFTTFQTALSAAYKIATGATMPTENYELFVIALLSPGENAILIPEIESFGGSASSLSEKWYPAGENGYPIPGLKKVTGRMCQWNLNPAGTSDGKYVKMAQSLATKLNEWVYTDPIKPEICATESTMTKSPTIKRIFYIHCSSGHDRTGLMACSYLNQKKIVFSQYANKTTFGDEDLTASYIMGTTLNKIKYTGGHYAKNCYDVNDKTQESATRSRCFLISTAYDKTVQWTAEQLVAAATGKTAPSLSIGTNALSGDSNYPSEPQTKTYVEPYYAWDNYTGKAPKSSSKKTSSKKAA